MGYSTQNASKSKRKRTAAQLERKRLIDREHQRARRSQNQGQMKQMEDEIRELQGRLRRAEALLKNLPVGNKDDNAVIPTSADSYAATDILPHSVVNMDLPRQVIVDTIAGCPPSDHAHSLIRPGLPSILHGGLKGASPSEYISSRNTVQPSSQSMAISAVISEDPVCIHEEMTRGQLVAKTAHSVENTLPNTVDPFCLCGKGTHSSYSECFEQNVAQTVVEASLNPSDAIIPRRPTLADLCLIGEGSNPVSRLVITYLRKPNRVKVSDLFGMFIGMYVLLRVRLPPLTLTKLETKIYSDLFR